LNRVRVQKGEERQTIPRSYESFGTAREERQRNMPVFLQGLRRQTYSPLLSKEDRHTAPTIPFKKGSGQDIRRSALFGRREKKEHSSVIVAFKKTRVKKRRQKNMHSLNLDIGRAGEQGQKDINCPSRILSREAKPTYI
jgi:hypothetical protein